MQTMTVEEFYKKYPRNRYVREVQRQATQPSLVPLEHWEQVMFFQWTTGQVRHHAFLEVEDFYAVPNGGHRNKAVAVQLMMEGVKPGIPDLENPHARRGFTGLHLETKRRKKWEIRDSQRDWIGRLQATGRCALVCVGWEALRDATLWYFGKSGWPSATVEEPRPGVTGLYILQPVERKTL